MYTSKRLMSAFGPSETTRDGSVRAGPVGFGYQQKNPCSRHTRAHTHTFIFCPLPLSLPQPCHTPPVHILGKDTVSGFRFIKTRQCNQFLYDSASDAFITREHQSQGTGSTSCLWHFPPPGTVHASHRMPVSKMNLPGNCMHHYYQMSNLGAGKKTKKTKRSEWKKKRPYFKMLHLIEAIWFVYMTTTVLLSLW